MARAGFPVYFPDSQPTSQPVPLAISRLSLLPRLVACLSASSSCHLLPSLVLPCLVLLTHRLSWWIVSSLDLHPLVLSPLVFSAPTLPPLVWAPLICSSPVSFCAWLLLSPLVPSLHVFSSLAPSPSALSPCLASSCCRIASDGRCCLRLSCLLWS